MKNDNIAAIDKKPVLWEIIANQHPAINCWIVLNAVAILALYVFM